MAAIFIPVSASTIFGVDQDNTYMISLKAQVKTLFNRASLDSLIASSTFTHTTSLATTITLPGLKKLTALKHRNTKLATQLNSADKPTVNLNPSRRCA